MLLFLLLINLSAFWIHYMVYKTSENYENNSKVTSSNAVVCPICPPKSKS